MTQAVTSRVSVSDNAVRAVTIPEVLYLYFVENKEPLLQFGPVTITLLPLLAAVLAEGILCAVLLARRGPTPPYIPIWCRCCGTLRWCRSAAWHWWS